MDMAAAYGNVSSIWLWRQLMDVGRPWFTSIARSAWGLGMITLAAGRPSVPETVLCNNVAVLVLNVFRCIRMLLFIDSTVYV